MYLGTFGIDDYVGIPAACHRFSTGAAYAPTVLTYSIYEEDGTTGIAENVDMVVAAPFDSIVGCYWGRVQLTAVAGFEVGKNYLTVVKATVDSVAAIQMHTFQIGAKVDTRHVGGTAQTAGDLAALVATVDTVVDGIAAKTVNLPASPAAVGSAMTLTSAYDAAKTAAQAGNAMTLTSAYDAAKTAAQAGDAMALTSGYDAAKTAAQAGDIPTATQNADGLLKRDMAAVTGEAARSPLNALRAIRNKVAIVDDVLTVMKEDDVTPAWTGAVTTDPAAEPVTGVDPS